MLFSHLPEKESDTAMKTSPGRQWHVSVTLTLPGGYTTHFAVKYWFREVRITGMKGFWCIKRSHCEGQPYFFGSSSPVCSEILKYVSINPSAAVWEGQDRLQRILRQFSETRLLYINIIWLTVWVNLCCQYVCTNIGSENAPAWA